MKRLFKNHNLRSVIELSGAWKFLFDADGIGEAQGWYNGLPSGETVIVPSCWNTDLYRLIDEGCGWYERRFLTEGGTLLLEFESVMTKATVWLDGVKIGEHYGAFTQFEFTVNDVTAGEHLIVVCADSRVDAKSFPQRYTDWFNYGGIARDVFAHELKGISVLLNHVVYELSADLTSASVGCELELYNASGSPVTDTVSVKVGDTCICSKEITLGAYERSVIKSEPVTMDTIKLWSMEEPNLYTVVASTSTDDVIDKVGFRLIEVKDNNILLNGKSIELLGVNRHEEHPDWGFAFPARLMKKDLDIIKDLGCNTIRGSHYPQTQIFVDMLDEQGILFWSEIPMWGVGFSEAALRDPEVMERGFEMHKEMVRFYYNHPSIVIWGMHNEIRTYIEGLTYETSRKFSEFLRENGGNRLITHADAFPFADPDMDFDDIICINLYKGWYNGNLQEWDKFVEEFDAHRRKNGWEHKPVIMSEFGAGALAGFHSHFDTLRWSEEYQRDLLEYCLELFHKTDYMRGMYIWQFCNIRTYPGLELNRVRCFNNKGIVDEYRNPKAAYFKVRELYKKYANEGK